MKNNLFLYVAYVAIVFFLLTACAGTAEKESEDADLLNLTIATDADFHSHFGITPGSYGYRQVLKMPSGHIILFHKITFSFSNKTVNLVYDPPRESVTTTENSFGVDYTRTYVVYSSCTDGDPDIPVNSINFEYDVLDSSRNVLVQDLKFNINWDVTIRCDQMQGAWASGSFSFPVN